MTSGTKQTDYVESQGARALGARLRRLSERVDREASAVYQGLNVPFEQRWFGVLDQLARHPASTVGEMATALGVTHAAVSQSATSLVKHGYVSATSDARDARRKPLALTPKGHKLVKQLSPTFEALARAAEELDREARGVVCALERLERALERTSLTERAFAHGAR